MYVLYVVVCYVVFVECQRGLAAVRRDRRRLASVRSERIRRARAGGGSRAAAARADRRRRQRDRRWALAHLVFEQRVPFVRSLTDLHSVRAFLPCSRVLIRQCDDIKFVIDSAEAFWTALTRSRTCGSTWALSPEAAAAAAARETTLRPRPRRPHAPPTTPTETRAALNISRHCCSNSQTRVPHRFRPARSPPRPRRSPTRLRTPPPLRHILRLESPAVAVGGYRGSNRRLHRVWAVQAAVDLRPRRPLLQAARRSIRHCSLAAGVRRLPRAPLHLAPKSALWTRICSQLHRPPLVAILRRSIRSQKRIPRQGPLDSIIFKALPFSLRHRTWTNSLAFTTFSHFWRSNFRFTVLMNCSATCVLVLKINTSLRN